ncbi:Rha family transcriptional regulator [Methylomonas montana]|uniref:Rha family transcriptional regulator n=1 Tax=Methylomonas montana TaxID=3058963 RepID=UPI002659E059|nr:Rha family transcriptional regulator [Methylomonas montana]WKJ91364.1 Rha family transcriptional regulator [Methylomonas montana]
MTALSLIDGQVTMSSLEIAKLTGKEHDNVLKDVRKVLDEAEIDAVKFNGIYKDSMNRDKPCFNLPRRECDLVVSGYSVKYRLAIIDRWHELEAMQSQPKTRLELAREQVALLENIERLEQERNYAIATKAEIGSRREATAMNTASQAVKLANKLSVELDRSKEYCTVKRMQMIHHGQQFNWRLLKSTGIEMGIEPIDVFDANYGTVKAYHIDVWREAYAIGLGETEALEVCSDA